MKVLRSLTRTAAFCRAAPRAVVLVPTMGALHAGHAALIARARRLAGPQGTVAVSIFVNPSQFGPKEDFSRYPRSLAADLRICSAEGADLVFHPKPEEMYGPGFSTWIEEEVVSRFLCGASRPGHFRGVCTIVLKLLLLTGADWAVFGRKDYQQCAVIQRMVRDLNVPVIIDTVSTVRESDGLALSSRNAYLNPDERAQAPNLRQALLAARAEYRRGERKAAALCQLVTRRIQTAALARIDYVTLADAATLEPVEEIGRKVVLAVAVFFGKTRLIDNLTLP